MPSLASARSEVRAGNRESKVALPAGAALAQDIRCAGRIGSFAATPEAALGRAANACARGDGRCRPNR
jgi:hypothetical protein